MGDNAAFEHWRWKRSPQFVYGVVALVLAAGAALLLHFWLGWNAYWLWLLAVNVVAFTFYRFDKRRAQRAGAMRVPEIVLLALTLVGGFIGAGFGMYVRPRHKVHKRKFVAALVVGALVQAGLVYWLYLH